MDFFARQEHAKKKTRLLVVYLLFSVVCIVIAMNAIAYLYMVAIKNQSYHLNEWLVQPKSLVVTFATIFIISIISFIQWRLLREGGNALALHMGATQVLVDTADTGERRLLNVVEEMAIASGIAMPNVYVMEHESGINAFVAGITQSDAVLVVTQGALRELTRQELQGVVGHEFSHIFHSDMRINLQLISLLAGILFLSDAGRFLLDSGNNRHCSFHSRHDDNANPLGLLFPVGVVLFIVGSIGLFFARLIKSSISRQREYLADAAAVQYTRDNQGLASALYKISEFSEGSTLTTQYAEEASHMCFSEPVSMFSGFLSGLLSTHPPVEKRIKAICPGWIPGRAPRISKVIRKQPDSQQSMFIPELVLGLTGNPKSKHYLTQNIGQPTSQHLTEAQRIIQGIPEALRLSSATNDTNTHSIQLVFALLISDDLQQIEQALIILERNYGVAFGQRVRELADLIRYQPRKSRLAIFDLAIPALRKLSRQQRKILFDALRQVIHLDSKISRFEYVLYWLLKKHLYGPGKTGKTSINSLKTVPKQVAIIIAMMIDASGNDTQSRRKVFGLIMDSIGLPTMDMPTTGFDTDAIHTSLMTLARLNPIPKKSLLCALEDCITEDKIIEPEEAELLRAIAALMGCPIPPLVG
jgi:Zn-dependent protease with chaperone function/uncharacterized tellurite resistance protein B-like protein